MLEHKHGVYYVQNFVPGNAGANTVLFRFQNSTDNKLYIHNVRFTQSNNTNSAGTTYVVQVLSEDLSSTVSQFNISVTASTRIINFTPAEPIVVSPRQIVNIYVSTAGASPTANVLTSVKIA